ncbi:hypothetical protein BGZ63DRAFT_402206 [Mariannaea sp. PMI_226]|nr:hypothetical protein BGZ63DRAFT_402206 [Mariannaea sp. PMI_226]
MTDNNNDNKNDNMTEQLASEADINNPRKNPDPVNYLKADFWKSGQSVSGFQPTFPGAVPSYNGQSLLQDSLEDVSLKNEEGEDLDEPPDGWTFATDNKDDVITSEAVRAMPTAPNGADAKRPWTFDDGKVVFVGSSVNEDEPFCDDEDEAASNSPTMLSGDADPGIRVGHPLEQVQQGAGKLNQVARAIPHVGNHLLTGICIAGRSIAAVCSGPIRETTIKAGEVGSYLGEKALEAGQTVAATALERLPVITGSLFDGVRMVRGAIMGGPRALPPGNLVMGPRRGT